MKIKKGDILKIKYLDLYEYTIKILKIEGPEGRDLVTYRVLDMEEKAKRIEGYCYHQGKKRVTTVAGLEDMRKSYLRDYRPKAGGQPDAEVEFLKLEQGKLF